MLPPRPIELPPTPPGQNLYGRPHDPRRPRPEPSPPPPIPGPLPIPGPPPILETTPPIGETTPPIGETTAAPIGAPRPPNPSPPPILETPGRPAWIDDQALAAAAVRLAQLLPPTVGLVAAVPRSGYPLAALVALHRHLPLAEIHPHASLRHCQTGYRYHTGPRDSNRGGLSAVAVIDDTVASGTAMATLAPALAALRATGRAVYTAVGFCNPELTHAVDFHAQTLALPHFLAWNFWNSCHAENVATDFDGILCPDYPGAADDEGPAYLAHVTNAPALAWPGRRPLAAIVTARLEKYRPQTVAWLRRHDIRHDRLIMAPHRTAAERSAHLNPGHFKAAWYAESQAALFVESCPHQAATIAQLTGRPVLCPPIGQAWNC